MTKNKAKDLVSAKGKSQHELSDLVGKKIKSIHLREVDVSGDKTNIRQFYSIVCSDKAETEFVLACDGGNEEKQYATVTLMDPPEFADFLEDTMSDDSEGREDDEEDLNEDEDYSEDDESEDDESAEGDADYEEDCV